MDFWVYILKCNDGSFYTGHTDDLESRLFQHASGLCKGYTLRRRPVVLVYCQSFPTRIEALEAERMIKGWTRVKKEALIAQDWPKIRKLAKKEFNNKKTFVLSASTAVEVYRRANVFKGERLWLPVS